MQAYPNRAAGFDGLKPLGNPLPQIERIAALGDGHAAPSNGFVQQFVQHNVQQNKGKFVRQIAKNVDFLCYFRDLVVIWKISNGGGGGIRTPGRR
mgnify:CR=1 FL=1